jgi:retron-type reverse transcriptase
VSRQGSEQKPFTISKRLVWQAYEQVKRNKGAAGVDGQSIEDFEKDLRNNLYKLWLRREALMVRVAVRDRHYPAVVAAG